MQQLSSGKKLLLWVALLALSGCRKDIPPVIEICILDGLGGGDCVEKDGSKLYRPPSGMKNYWSTSADDMAAFSSWCFKTSNSQQIENQMRRIELDARSGSEQESQSASH